MDMITGDNVPEYLRATRKLSFILMLSDSNEYTGGQFDFNVSVFCDPLNSFEILIHLFHHKYIYYIISRINIICTVKSIP